MSGLALLFTAVLVGSPPAGMVAEQAHGVTFVHRPRHASEARRLARMTPRIAGKLSRELGLASLPPIEVRVAQSPDDLQALSPRDPPPPRDALGVAYPGRRLVIVALSAGASTLPISLEALYTHELSHLVLAEAVGHRPVPRWFAEGLAIRQSGELPWARLEALWGATVSGRLVPIRRLDRAFPRGEHLGTLAYAEAGELVSFLAEEDRPGALAELCERVRSGVPFEQALEANYATGIEELEQQFFRRLDHRFSVIPALTGVSAVWGIVAILLVAAWRRKKREARAKLARWTEEERAADLADTLVEPAAAAATYPPDAIDPDAHGMLEVPEGVEAVPPPLPEDIGEGVRRVYHDGRYHTVH